MKTQTSAADRDAGLGSARDVGRGARGRDGQRIDNFLGGAAQGRAQEPDLPHAAHRRGAGQRQAGQARSRAWRPATRCAFRRCGWPSAARAEAPPATSRAASRRRSSSRTANSWSSTSRPASPAMAAAASASARSSSLRAARPRDTLELAHRLDRDTSGVLVLDPQALGADRAADRDPRGPGREALPGAARRRAAAKRDSTSTRRCANRCCRAASAWCASTRAARRRVRASANSSATPARAWSRSRSTPAAPTRSACTPQHIGHPLAGDEKYGDARIQSKNAREGLEEAVPARRALRVRPGRAQLRFQRAAGARTRRRARRAAGAPR